MSEAIIHHIVQAIAAVFICALAYLVGTYHGHRVGYAKGEAKGWQDGYFGRVKNERERRNALGEFIKKGVRP